MNDKFRVAAVVGVPAMVAGLVVAQEQKRRPESAYTWGWISWGAFSALGFTALEGYAMAKGEHGNTLSVHWRRTFGIYPKKRWHPFGRAAVCAGLGWLAYHIAFEPGDDPRLRASGIVVLSETTKG